MSINVEIPIRITTDPHTLADHPDAVVAAARRALLRAMAKSRDEVLGSTGGYLGVELKDIATRWTGGAAATVPAAARRQLERGLGAAILDSAEDAGLFDFVDAAAEKPLPLSRPAKERLDPKRFAALLFAYRVPSYEGGSEWLTLQYSVKIREKGKTIGWGLLPVEATPEQTLFDQAMSRLGIRKDQIPAGGAYGFTTGGGVIMGDGHRYPWALVFTTDKGAKWHWIGFEGFWGFRLEGTGADAKFVRVPNIPRARNAFGRWMDKPASDEAGLELMNEQFGKTIREDLTTFYGQNTSQLTGEDLTGAVELGAGAQLLERWQQLAESQLLLDVRMADASVLLGLPAEAAAARWEGEGYFVPYTALVDAEPMIQTGDAGRGMGFKGAGEGAGKAKGKAGEGKTGEGEGEQQGKGEGKGEGEGDQVPGSMPRYPTFEGFGLFGLPLVCESFEGDRSTVEMGAPAAHLQRLIDQIAFRLQIEPCSYAATFCVNAAEMIGRRANAIGRYAAEDFKGTYYTAPSRQGNLGLLQFVPSISPALHMMRYLAETATLIEYLHDETMDLAKSNPALILTGEYVKNSPSWRLRFMESYRPAMSSAIADMFIMTCRILLLQMLKGSREEIQKRIDNFANYAPFFEMILATILQRDGELKELRDRLKDSENEGPLGLPGGTAGAIAVTSIAPWVAATQALVAMVRGGEGLARGAGREGEIVTADGQRRIRDSQGALWTKEQLEIAILISRGMGEDADPLIKQLFDVPETVQMFKLYPQRGRELLRGLLNDMLDNNAEQEFKVRFDYKYAFQASKINEDIPNATVPYSKYRLGGIHLEAHKQIGQFFVPQFFYAHGLDFAFDVELGTQGLIHFFEFTGIVLLSVICPPAGFAAGVAVAGAELEKAYAQKRLYQSLIDPDKVLSQAEVELDLYVAWIGFALSFIPEIGTVIGAARQGIKVAFKEGLKAGAGAAGKYVANRISKQIAEALARDLMEVFIRDMIAATAIMEVIQHVAAPFVSKAMQELEVVSSTGGREKALELIEQIIMRNQRVQEEAQAQ